MINYTNYARSIELRPYIDVNEAQIGHASDNSAAGFDKLMGGALTGSAYTSNYNAFVDAISASIDKGDKLGTVEVKHDDGSHFLNVRYTIDYTNPNDIVVNLYRTDYTSKTGKTGIGKSQAQSAQGGQTVNASPTVQDAANKILGALAGSSLGEDEDVVYSVFTNNIKSDADLKSLLAYWKSQKAPYVPAAGRSWTKFEDIRKFYAPNMYQGSYGLDVWIKQLFSSDEIKKLNEIIKKYSTFQF